MRPSGLPSAVNRLSFHVRPFHASFAPAKTPDVFANSLRQTLAAHRSSNRARLIRKIVPRTDRPDIFRPEIPPECRADYQPRLEPTLPTPTPEQSQIANPLSKRHQRRLRRSSSSGVSRIPKDRPAGHAIQSADTINGRPEQQPWLRELGPFQTNGDGSTHLDAEIRALEHYLVPSSREQEQIDRLRVEVTSFVEAVVPHTPQVIGSRGTGLALAHSNLDFLLPFEDLPRSLDRVRRPSATRPQIRDAHTDLLRQVGFALRRSTAFDNFVHRHGKHGPMLTVRHRPTGLNLSFSCGEGVPALTEYLRDYQAEYPALRPLYVATRTLLEARGLFGAPKSSIGPDALAILLVAFLKMNHGRFSGYHRLGDQLLALLQLYGTGINLQDVGVAGDPPGFFTTETLRSVPDVDEPAYCRGQRSLISAKRTAAAKGNLPAARRPCIQDPTHYMNDLGRSCTRTPELQRALAAAYEQLCLACKNWANDSENMPSILTTALQANFEPLENLRAQIMCPTRRNPS
ncbi:hypothetical protein NUU61_000375 [Penicillium alfredii]|uniref:Polynucleotide adenylyltransferase n=1 Tax=Penicillium alfredii TaxID=1506179 RepID=A0A9W9KQY7_9EURO|nr:uncharacterized protein NUU61_000375 [Penicillium alfredii]KAJ5114616.1 hypothetical protein NUU61_000375 [Penicillium alfredii]